MSKKGLQETQHRIEPDKALEADNSHGESPKAANVARRRALIAGLAAAPVVLSLMDRSAWAGATFVSCTLVASYVNAGNKWQSPRPANSNGTLSIGPQDINHCRDR